MLVRCPSTVFGGHEQRGGDLLGLEALGHQLGHAPLRRGELAGGGDSAAHARQLVAGPFRPDRRAHLLEGRLRRFERLAGRPLLPSPALGRPRAPGATARAPAGSARPRSERPPRPAPPTRRRARRVPPGAARGNALPPPARTAARARPRWPRTTRAAPRPHRAARSPPAPRSGPGPRVRLVASPAASAEGASTTRRKELVGRDEAGAHVAHRRPLRRQLARRLADSRAASLSSAARDRGRYPS